MLGFEWKVTPLAIFFTKNEMHLNILSVIILIFIFHLNCTASDQNATHMKFKGAFILGLRDLCA